MSGFQDIYENYSKPVYRFLLSLTRKEEMAEELLQETFYRAFLHMDQYEGRSSLYTWLCQIGKNAWLKECRRKNFYSEKPIEELDLTLENSSPETIAIINHEYERVRKALMKLDEPYKDVFILHAYGEITLKEIAASYGKSESWARVTYFRAKQQILQEVSK